MARVRFAFVLAALSLSALAYLASPALGEVGDAPGIDREYATNVHAAAADVNAALDPNGAPTTVHFEYGLADCSANPCASTPTIGVGEADLYDEENFINDVKATQALSGLSPATTYHYRVIASNAGGVSEGPDQTFKTFPLASGFQLLENRGYEMVSPQEKTGGNIEESTSHTRPALDGNGVVFSSRGVFGDVPGGGGSGGVQYIARRGPNGWTTHGITPPEFAEPLLPATTSLYVGDFTPNLDRGVFLALDSLGSEDPNAEVADRANLYLRTDALAPGAGSYSLLSGCPGCTEPLPPEDPLGSVFNVRLAYADATPDLSHVLFEDPANLTSEAIDANGGAGLSVSESKLYEWDGGTVRLVGILPDGACGSPPCAAEASVAGSGPLRGGIAENAISDDGRRVIFTAAPFSPAAGVAGYSGGLYERVDHSSTIQLNASERTDCAAGEPCSGTLEPDPVGTQPATFLWVTPSGDRAFFSTSEQLIDDDKNGGSDIYMYDASAPAGEHLTLISENRVDGSGAGAISVIGGSDDGHYVYFAAAANLLPGQLAQRGDKKVYVWHDGDLRSIAGSLPYVTWNESANRYASRVTPDGHSLALTLLQAQEGKEGADELTGYEAQGPLCGGEGSSHTCTEVYTYSYDTNRLQCASCPETKAAPQNKGGDPLNFLGSDATLDSTSVPSAVGGGAGRHRSQWITDDGRLVFFSTPEALVPEDTNGHMDAYEYDTQTGKAHLISTGESKSVSVFLGATADGHNVFFTTRQRLVPGDTDDSVDLYDARVDGGFPFPGRAPICEGDACQSPIEAPNDPTPASSAFSGSGNVTARRSHHKKRHHKQRRHSRKHTTRKHG